MESECEDQTMREKARRLAADDRMTQMTDNLLETFGAMLDAFIETHGSIRRAARN